VLVFVLAAFCWTKSLLCNVAAFTGMLLYPESTLQLCYSRRFCEVFKDLFRFPVSRLDDVVFRPDAHQSTTSVRTTRSFRPVAHLSTVPSIRTTCHSVRTSDRQASSVRTTCFFRPDTYIVSRSFCASLLRLDVSATCPDAYKFSNGSLILSKFQEREDQSTVRTMWYPVRTRISVRQESQFKMNRLDI
jgi:hypothetical protein